MSLHPDIYGAACRNDDVLVWAQRDRMLRMALEVEPRPPGRLRRAVRLMVAMVTRLGEHSRSETGATDHEVDIPLATMG